MENLRKKLWLQIIWNCCSLVATTLICWHFFLYVTPQFDQYVVVTQSSPSLRYWKDVDKKMPVPGERMIDIVAVGQMLGCGDGAMMKWMAHYIPTRLLIVFQKGCIADHINTPLDPASAVALSKATCNQQFSVWTQIEEALLTHRESLPVSDVLIVSTMLERGSSGARKISALCNGSASVSELSSGLLALVGFKIESTISDDYSMKSTLIHDPFTLERLSQSVRSAAERSKHFEVLRDILPKSVTVSSLLVIGLTALLATRWCFFIALALYGMWFAMLGNLDFALAFPTLRYNLLSNFLGDWLSWDLITSGHVSLWPPALAFALTIVAAALARCVPIRHQIGFETNGFSLGWYFFTAVLVIVPVKLFVGGSAAVAILYGLSFLSVGRLLAKEFSDEVITEISQTKMLIKYIIISAISICSLWPDKGHLMALGLTLCVGGLLIGSTKQKAFRTKRSFGLHVPLAVMAIVIVTLFLTMPELPGISSVVEASSTLSEREFLLRTPGGAEVSDFVRINAWLRSVALQSFPSFNVPWTGLGGVSGLPLQAPSDYVITTLAGRVGTLNAAMLIACWLLVSLVLSGLAFIRATERNAKYFDRLFLLIGATWLLSIVVRGMVGLLGSASITMMTGTPICGLSNGVISSIEIMIAIALIIPNLRRRK